MDVHVVGGFRQVDGQHQLPLFPRSRLQTFDRLAEGRGVAVQHRPQGLLGQVLGPGAAPVPGLEGGAAFRGELLHETGVGVVGEDAVAAVGGAAQGGAVVAAPMQEEVDVDDSVAGGQLDRHAPGQGHARILLELAVLLGGVEAPVASRHRPEDDVVVERDVPLQVPGAVLHEVPLQHRHRRHVEGVDVAVPGRGAVVPRRAAHQHHAGDRRPLRHAQELAGDPESVFPLPELDRGRGRRVDQALVVAEPRLRPRLPGVGVLGGPERLLALDQGFELLPQAVELGGGDDVAKDDETVIEQFLTVDFHEATPNR